MSPTFGRCAWIAAFLVVGVLWSDVLPSPDTVWTNNGAQSIACESPASGVAQYATVGQTILFRFQNIQEIDTGWATRCGECVENDPTRQARLVKVGGTLDGTWASAAFSAPNPEETVEYVVPANAEPGKTIQLQAQISDTRDGSDARHDDWQNNGPVYTITVTDKFPTGIGPVLGEDRTGPINFWPTGIKTYGNFRFTMELTGEDFPAGRTNWNGYMVTESCGNVEGTAADFAAGVGVLGQPVGGESTFTAGTQGAGDNRFYDTSLSSSSVVVLAASVQTTTITWDQDYIFGDPSGDGWAAAFLNTGVLTRPAEDRVKVSWNKEPAQEEEEE
jgi:hypothetical protein